MQLITLASAAATLFATVSASASAFNLNSSCIETQPKVRVYNRCSYDVHLWSVLKGQGCPSEDGAILKQGDFYQENFRPSVDKAGTSIKISKDSQCKGTEIVQLEYYIETENPGYNYNYLDVSYVDCGGKDCPTAANGFYLKSGNQNGEFMANSVNEICPILSCGSWDECAKVAYIQPDDRQTKSCDPKADLEFYMCGGEAPGEGTYEQPATSQAPSTPEAPSSVEEKPEPTSTEETPAYTPEVAAAAVTSAPVQQPKVPNVKTEVVYVTQYEYVNAKRHAHGHRHQHFRA